MTAVGLGVGAVYRSASITTRSVVVVDSSTSWFVTREEFAQSAIAFGMCSYTMHVNGDLQPMKITPERGSPTAPVGNFFLKKQLSWSNVFIDEKATLLR